MSAPDITQKLRGQLIVSCQAPPGDPLHGPASMTAMALAAQSGDAAGIRAEGLADVRAIREAVDLPLIGLWKVGGSGVYITPTPRHAAAVARSGADIVAFDATQRPRPDGSQPAETVTAIRSAGRLAMADVANLPDALAAEEAGAELVSTTLSGYVGDGPAPTRPDLTLVETLARRVTVPVVAEGRIGTPEQARAALDAGAFAVVVGTAITAPGAITARFTRSMLAPYPAEG